MDTLLQKSSLIPKCFQMFQLKLRFHLCRFLKSPKFIGLQNFVIFLVWSNETGNKKIKIREKYRSEQAAPLGIF